MINSEVIQDFFDKNVEFFDDFILLENKNTPISGGDIDLLWVGSWVQLKRFVDSNGRLGFHPLLNKKRKLLYSLSSPLWIETGDLYVDVQREFFLQTVDGKNLIPYDMSVKDFVNRNFDRHSFYSCKCVVIEVKVLIDLVKLIIEDKNSAKRWERILSCMDSLCLKKLENLLRPVFFNFTPEIIESLSSGCVDNLRMSYLKSNNY